MKWLFSFLVLLSATRLGKESVRAYFIVWNVGQGQWTTWVQANECRHFDWGGEFFPLMKARAVCSERRNLIFLSHWDWDHVGGLQRASVFSDICLARAPIGRSSPRKEKLLPRKPCPAPDFPLWEWKPASAFFSRHGKIDTNSESRIFSNGRFLVEGDSPQKMERRWATATALKSVGILVLGHHGSRTSTSDFLLAHLPGLHQAVSSSRWARYGHPHAETLARLRRKKIPVLRTQDWGSLWFEM